MAVTNRIKNTKRNIVAGMLQRLVAIVFPFINRTVILYVLGAEYTGLSGLFSSILEVLSIAELGFNSAIVYSLYKPMAENDTRRVRELVSLFRKIYVVVGTVILVLGIGIMPFISKILKGSYPSDINIYILFLLYLLNSAISYYLFSYKECLLIADQRKDIADSIRTIINICRYLIQFLVLVVSHNFYLYLVVVILCTIVTNVCIQRVTIKRYPFYYDIKEKIEFPRELIKQVKGLLIDRLGDTCRNSFDSIIITTYLGLTATAIYGNYYYIYAALYAIMLVMCNSMSASVGNSIVKESVEKNFNDLNRFTYIFSWIAGWCTICLACLYQPFMLIWAGEDLLLSDYNMMLFCLYFYIINMTNIRNQYISGTGIWWRLKIPCICEAIANLTLNIILGKLFGISGVIIATIITIFILNFSWRTSILFKYYFKGESFVKYLLQYMYYLLITLVGFLITYLICNLFKYDSFKGIFTRGIICLLVPNLVMWFGYRPLKYYKECKCFVLNILKK